ncbi:uncharacterized protein C3orf18 homolog [Macrobrachium nipponense]|uniref:uncharacterized protein C3orf18 homolog n=1 Tax=Macrobrachium nipponense TaxID=159736 RepID=UPI0030C89ED6
MALIFDVIVVLTASTLIAAQNVTLPLTTASPSAPKLNKPITDAKVTAFSPLSNETHDTITLINVSVPLPPTTTSGVKTTTTPSTTKPSVVTTTYYTSTVPTTIKTTTSTAAPPTTPKTTSTVFVTTTTTTTVRSTTVFPRNSSTPAISTTENDETTTTELPSTTPVPPEEPNAWLSVFLSVFILLAVILLIGVAVWFIRRRRQLERLRHQLMPMYNFDPTDDVDDWENQLLEEERSLRPEADKVQMYTGNSTFDPSQRAPSNMTSND